MRRGPVSAAAMQARAVPEPRAFLSEHCSAEEYDAFLGGCEGSVGIAVEDQAAGRRQDTGPCLRNNGAYLRNVRF